MCSGSQRIEMALQETTRGKDDGREGRQQRPKPGSEISKKLGCVLDLLRLKQTAPSTACIPSHISSKTHRLT